MSERPIIGVTTCNKMFEEELAQTVKQRYLDGLIKHADAIPVLIPALGKTDDAMELVQSLDGILLTGSTSNIDPRLYKSDKPQRDHADPKRDLTTMALIRAGRHFGVPIFGICRGFQEINVALGGTLVDERESSANNLVHHAADGADLNGMFAHEHEIELSPAGLWARLTGESTLSVNSVHYQMVEQLGADLRVEATAPDGVVEAFASREADPLVFAVQWHPEWQPDDKRHYLSFWRFVGERARRRRAELAQAV